MSRVMSILPLPAPPTDGYFEAISASQLPTEEEKKADEEDQNKAKPTLVATHKRTIGIIHPPPDIRKIIDKMSEFVAKHGPEFEEIVISNAGIPKFNFLSASDPYHAYYQHKLSEVCAQETLPTDAFAVTTGKTDTTVKTDPAAHFRKAVEPPETEQYTIRLPEGITGEELDIIKLTAQFAARNGNSFLTELANNPEFHFLKPTHSMFMLFTAFADAYSKCLMPAKGLTDKLKKSVVDRTTVLERCLHRLKWDRSQEQARQKAEHEIEQERTEMSLIDWHDFVAVEIIDFVDDEDEILPIPMTLEEVVKRNKISTVDNEVDLDTSKVVEMEIDEEEIQLVQKGLRENGDDLKNDEPPMRIVKNWKRAEDKIPAGRSVVSPITGELIPTDEMSEHIRISLIDPKYKLQKERMFAKIRVTTLAQDDEISRNIVALARTRPDIFGTTQEEVSNAVKAEIAKKEDEKLKQVIWDAPPPPRPCVPLIRPLNLALNMPCMPTNTIPYSTSNTTANMMPFQHLMMNQPFTLTPQHGIPLPPPPMPQGMPLPPEPKRWKFDNSAPPLLPEEPEPKRRKFDDSALVPEEQFLAQHPGPVRISVTVPDVDEGNLKGQVLHISVQSLSENVANLKEKISAEIQLPANKQKLSGMSGFLKDNFTLAYYNIGNGDSLTLSLRERGGRKR